MSEFKPITILYLNNLTIHSKGELGVIFSIIIGLIIILYLLVERSLSSRKRICSSDIWKNIQKLQFYAQQENIAQNLYGQYFNGLAGLSIFTLINAIVLVIYPLLFITFLSYFLITIITVTLLFEMSTFVRKQLENEFAKAFNIIAMFTFLIMFIVIMIDFTSKDPSTNVIFALISFILLRRMIGGLRIFISSTKALYNKKEKLVTIFFKEHTRDFKLMANKKQNFWLLFENNAYYKWIPQTVKIILNKDIEITKIQWFELGIADEIAFELETYHCSYLIKIFNKSLHTKAHKEITLIENIDTSSFTLKLLGKKSFEGFDCHLFQLPSYSFPTQIEFEQKHLEVLHKLSQISLPNYFKEQYKMTHELLHQRIDTKFCERVKVAANQKELMIVRTFEYNLPFISKKIQILPLRLFIPEFSITDTLLIDGKLKLLNLENWTIEPLGFTSLHTIDQQEILANTIPKDLKNTVEIMCIAKECEDHYHRNNFKNVIMLMENINKIYSDT